MSQIILSTQFSDLKLFRRGKVRDVYEAEDSLLIVSTDRISAFDVVLPNGIPEKGKVLNQLSLFWFYFTQGIIPNHVITSDVSQYPASLQKYADALDGRSMLVKKTKPIAFECVVRGYLAGSAYKEYQEKGSVCGMQLPSGLRDGDKLPQTMFTPATKEEHGHDINVDEAFMEKKLGVELSRTVREASIRIYEKAAAYALKRGIIIADTKFEFGSDKNQIILIDEVLTPDSSRFWPKETYQPGRSQASYDKQFVRDYLESISWDKNPPAPTLPEEVVIKTADKYKEALRSLADISL
ncbi:MAG: phosphoribosylaminoimidazolesuccinocarboxamide synthase [Candidatus Omnitrophota bacterium]